MTNYRTIDGKHAVPASAVYSDGEGNFAEIDGAWKHVYPDPEDTVPLNDVGSPAPTDNTKVTDEADDDNVDELPARGGKKSQATELVDLAESTYSFHVASTGEPFAVPVGGAYFARMLRGGRNSLRAELAAAYVDEHGRAPSSSALSDALLVCEGRSLGKEQRVLSLRVARHSDGIVLDLGDDTGAAVVVKPGEWKTVARSPVLFRRTALTEALARPVAGGNLPKLLDDFLNLDEHGVALLSAWLVSTMFPNLAHAIPTFTGEGGVGKTTAAWVLSRIVDPAGSQVRKPPRDSEAWVTQAAGSWVVALDNISNIQPWLSDSLCRAVTGEGDVRRRLYSDSELYVFSFRRCVILNGIDLGALRGDLGRRLILVELDPIRDFIDDDEFIAKFVEKHPQLLGALLDTTAEVLNVLPNIEPVRVSSMASFARILKAFDEVVGTATLDTYLALSGRVAEEVVEGDVVASALVEFMTDKESWTGTAGELLAAINALAGEDERKAREWPSSGSSMAGALRRVAPSLRQMGMGIEYNLARGPALGR